MHKNEYMTDYGPVCVSDSEAWLLTAVIDAHRFPRVSALRHEVTKAVQKVARWKFEYDA